MCNLCSETKEFNFTQLLKCKKTFIIILYMPKYNVSQAISRVNTCHLLPSEQNVRVGDFGEFSKISEPFATNLLLNWSQLASIWYIFDVDGHISPHWILEKALSLAGLLGCSNFRKTGYLENLLGLHYSSPEYILRSSLGPMRSNPGHPCGLRAFWVL